MATIFLSDPDKMRKLQKAHSIDAPNQIFIHLAVLEKMRKLYKGPSIDDPCKILIHLAELFQRRGFLMYQ